MQNMIMQINQNQQKQLNEILEENGVQLAYIFGSFAKDKFGPLSDLDIAVFFSREIFSNKYLKKESKIAFKAGKIFKINKVDIINLATVNNPLLKYNAVFGGKPILIKNKKVRFDLEKEVMQEYEDTKYLRETQFRLMIKRIKEGTFAKAGIKSKYLDKILNKNVAY